ncbi:MAG: hypothetical protein QXI64_10660 [Sulfolobales archaeon]
MGDYIKLDLINRWWVLWRIAVIPALLGLAAAVPTAVVSFYILSWLSGYVSVIYSFPAIQDIVSALPGGKALLGFFNGVPWWVWLLWPAAASIFFAVFIVKLKQTLRLYGYEDGYNWHARRAIVETWDYIDREYEDPPLLFLPPISIINAFRHEGLIDKFYDKCVEDCKRLGLPIVWVPDRRLKRLVKWGESRDEWCGCHVWFDYIWDLQKVAIKIYRGWIYTLSLAIATLITIRSTPPPPPQIEAIITNAIAYTTQLAPYIPMIIAAGPTIISIARYIIEALICFRFAAAIADRWSAKLTGWALTPGVEVLLPSLMILATPLSPVPIYALSAAAALIAGYRVFKNMFKKMMIRTGVTLAKQLK